MDTKQTYKDYKAFKITYTDHLTLLFITKIRECPECQSNHFETDPQYNLVCRSCGLVLAGLPPPYASYTRIDYPYGALL